MENTIKLNGPKLTLREIEILDFIAKGFSSKQIADRLSISTNTVANHRRNMLRKRGAKSSAELVSYNSFQYAI
jgi:DNA-binding CsgD family transcriptional regulator